MKTKCINKFTKSKQRMMNDKIKTPSAKQQQQQQQQQALRAAHHRMQQK